METKNFEELRALFMKQKLCEQISKYGSLWLTEEQIDEKMSVMRSDKEKRLALKFQLQFGPKWQMKVKKK